MHAARAKIVWRLMTINVTLKGHFGSALRKTKMQRMELAFTEKWQVKDSVNAVYFIIKHLLLTANYYHLMHIN